MIYLIRHLVLNPEVWIFLVFLGALCWLSCSLRFKSGRLAAALMLSGVWIVLTFTAQLLRSDDFLDNRFWILSGLTVAASIAPIFMLAMAVPHAIPRRWAVGGGVISVLVGAVALSVVGLLTVCALGIDCM